MVNSRNSVNQTTVVTRRILWAISVVFLYSGLLSSMAFVSEPGTFAMVKTNPGGDDREKSGTQQVIEEIEQQVIEEIEEIIKEFLDNVNDVFTDVFTDATAIELFTSASVLLTLALFICSGIAWLLAESRVARKMTFQAVAVFTGYALVLDYGEITFGNNRQGYVTFGVLVFDLLILWDLIRSVLRAVGIPVDEVTRSVFETIRDVFVSLITSLATALLTMLLQVFVAPVLNLVRNVLQKTLDWFQGPNLVRKLLGWFVSRMNLVIFWLLAAKDTIS